MEDEAPQRRFYHFLSVCVTFGKSRHLLGLFLFYKMRSRVPIPLRADMRMEWDTRLQLWLRDWPMPTVPHPPPRMLVLPFLLCLNLLLGQWVYISHGHVFLYISLKPPFPEKK